MPVRYNYTEDELIQMYIEFSKKLGKKDGASSKDFIKKAQEINNPYIPDDIEKFTEELLLKGAEALEKTVNVDEIIHRILGEEKTAIGI